MSPASKESVEQVRKVIHELLEGRTSKGFLDRADVTLNDWNAGALTAAQACDKIKKSVALFIGEDLAKTIGERCAPIVMRESAAKK